MGNREETSAHQSRERKLRPEFTVLVLLFISVSSILWIQNLDRQLKIATFDSSHGILRNNTGVAIRMETVARNETSAPQPSSSFVGTDNTTLHYEKAFDEEEISIHHIQIKGDEAFMWQGAQSRLCKHIKRERKELKKTKKKYRLQLNLFTRCEAIHKRHQHGNFMFGVYAMKIAAMAYAADFSFRCIESEAQDNLFWWLQSGGPTAAAATRIESGSRSVSERTTKSDIQASQYLINNTLYNPSRPTSDLACRGMGKVALNYASEYVRRDMRAMAMELLPSMERKGMTIDEVVIHLRCGDIISKRVPATDNNYGLLQFQAYRKNIPPTAKSIGIVTAPFSEKDRRQQDHGSGRVCKTLVLELVDYLKSHFPNAKVRVRNDAKESIPEVVSRLILAQHNFCVRSTFCLLPSIASFGTTFIQQGGAAYFMDDVSEVYDDVQLINEPFLLAHEIEKKGFNATLQWLTEK